MVSIAAGPAVLEGLGAVVLPCSGQTGIRGVFPRKLLSKESLKLPYSTSCATCFRIRAARCSGDARQGRASVIVEVGVVVRIGARGRSLPRPHIQRAQSRRQLGALRQVVARVVVEACRKVTRNSARRNRAGPFRCGPRRDLTDGTRGVGAAVAAAAGLVPGAVWFDRGQVAAVFAEVAHPMFANRGIYAGVGRRRGQCET